MDEMISVIVATYNQEHTIGRTLDSILMQKCHLPVEIVIGEDGSKDGTLAVCRQYEARYPDCIRVLANGTNKGILDNYFDCMLACRGKYIADCAGDDFWIDDQKLEKELLLLEQHPDVGIVHTDWQYCDESTGAITASPKPLRRHAAIEDGSHYLEEILTQTSRPSIHLCTSLYRADWIRQEHNENLPFFRNKDYPCEDLQVAFFMAMKGKVAYLEDITLNYSWGGETISNSASSGRLFNFFLKATRLSNDLAVSFDLKTDGVRSFLTDRCHTLAMHAFRSKNKEAMDVARNLPDEWQVKAAGKTRLLYAMTKVPGLWDIALLMRRLVLRLKHLSFLLLFLFSSLLFALPADAQWEKMSPFVREQVLLQKAQNRVRGTTDSRNRQMCVLVRCEDGNLLRNHGAKVLASWNDVHVVRIPINRIASLAGCREVLRIEAGKPCYAQMDTAAVMVQAPALWNAAVNETPYTGKGVLVGVMDIGFDLTHPTFFDDEMADYRIKAVWDMIDRTDNGEPFVGDDTTYVGRQYLDTESILRKGHSYDAFLTAHGSHTAAIAAGSGAPRFTEEGAPLYRGIAPQADLCLVSNATGADLDSIPDEDELLYTTATDLLGFKYIFDHAEHEHKPCVISFSEGYHPDFYGQDILYREMLEDLLGEGRILVAAAGNESSFGGSYFHKSSDMERAGSFVLPKSSYAIYTYRSSDKIDVQLTFYKDEEDKSIVQIHTDQILSCQDSILIDTLDVYGNSYQLIMAAYPSCYDNNDWATELYITSLSGKVVGSSLPLSVALVGKGVDAEMYSLGSYFCSNPLDAELCQQESSHNIHNPGGFPRVICVGAITSRSSQTNKFGYTHQFGWGEVGEYSQFSSVGPTLAGVEKPDVVAPGSCVISAGSSFYHGLYPDDYSIVRTFQADDRTHYWVYNVGTSMSTPVVAGVVAIWLEACPWLTPEQVMEAIAATSIHCDASLSYPNRYYGHGLIDAKAGLEYVLYHFSDHIEDFCSAEASQQCYDLMGRIVANPVAHGIYIKGGRKFLR